ncbi:MAG: dTDP-glucose 4,6-dehydratase, partial [Planctomycetales bacterium]|nr:dTDP-glucose 4,6-dehydratase [Planctomycetales bacterium]
MGCFPIKTVLVTGGAGFIGSCFVRQLIGDGGYRVVNLDKLTYAGDLASLGEALEHPRHEFVRGDVCDAELCARLLAKQRPQAVVHLAAESHVDRSIDSPADFVRTNVQGTYTLLEAVREYWAALGEAERETFRYIQVSTDEVYGSLGSTGQFTESSPYRPNSPYAATKAAADHLVRAYHHTYGLPTIVTNCSNNFGPYQFPEKMIPLMILNALDGRRLPIYGDGNNVRDWLFVED